MDVQGDCNVLSIPEDEYFSDRVAGAGCFGAALMLRPELVAECAQAISEAIDVPVTIKCRLGPNFIQNIKEALSIGVDDVDRYEDVSRFVKIVSEGSTVEHFIIHARKCLLNGLSPHQNRTIPPLRYRMDDGFCCLKS